MAYKFQLGAAKLGGAIEATGGVDAPAFTGSAVTDGLAAAIVAEVDNGEIASSKVAIANGKIIIGNNDGDAAEFNVSGDATMAANGVLTIADNAVSLAKMAGITRGSIILGDASGDPSLLGKGTAAQFLQSNGTDPSYVSISGDATVAAGGALTIAAGAVENSMLADDAVGPDELASNAVVEASIVDNAVSLAKMAGLARGKFIIGDASGDPSALALGSAGQFLVSDNDDLLYRSLSGDATLAANGALSLAAAQTNVTSVINAGMGKIGTDAAQEYIDFGTSNEIKFAVNNQLVATAEAGKFVVNGDLQVMGTTTTVNSTTINISSSFTFEGPADDHETVLSAGSPSADTTLSLPTLSAGSYFIPALADAATAGSAAVTAAEFALLDGDTARGTSALADGDGFMHNDNGTMKHTNVLKMFEYTVAKFSGDATVADTGALTISADAVEHSMLNDNCISGFTELTGAQIADADELLISDGGTLKKVGVDSLRGYMSAPKSPNVIGDANATLQIGLNVASANTSAARTWTLPASAGVIVGDSIKVKAAGVSSGVITIARAGSQTIDGSATTIVLESDNAAVELVYVATDDWRVF